MRTWTSRGKVRELLAEYEALSPERRELVERWLSEDRPEFELLDELKARVLDGSLSTGELEQWLSVQDRETTERADRRMQDPDSKAKPPQRI